MNTFLWSILGGLFWPCLISALQSVGVPLVAIVPLLLIGMIVAIAFIQPTAEKTEQTFGILSGIALGGCAWLIILLGCNSSGPLPPNSMIDASVLTLVFQGLQLVASLLIVAKAKVQ